MEEDMTVRPCGGSPVLSAVRCDGVFLTEAQLKRIKVMQDSLALGPAEIDEYSRLALISEIHAFINGFPKEIKEYIKTTYFPGLPIDS